MWSRIIDEGGLSDSVDAVPVDGQGQIATMGTVEEDATVTVMAVRKLDASGNMLWQRRLSYSDTARGHDVEADAQGNIVVAGSYGNLNTGESDSVLAKLDASGQILWTDVIPQGWVGRPQRIVLEPQGNVYSAVTVEGTVVADGPYMLLRKLSPAGQLLWSVRYDGLGTAYAVDVALSLSGALLSSAPRRRPRPPPNRLWS